MNFEILEQKANVLETVRPEVSKLHKRLMDLPGSKSERISGVLPFYVDEQGNEYGAVILEQEYAGSDSFIVLIYDFVGSSFLKPNYYVGELADGREANLHLTKMYWVNRCDYDELHQVCAMIDGAIDRFYANNLLCDW